MLHCEDLHYIKPHKTNQSLQLYLPYQSPLYSLCLRNPLFQRKQLPYLLMGLVAGLRGVVVRTGLRDPSGFCLM